jgi:hypothetical protein
VGKNKGWTKPELDMINHKQKGIPIDRAIKLQVRGLGISSAMRQKTVGGSIR